MSLSPNAIAAFCEAEYKRPLCPLNGAVNIVYIEGLNQDGSFNADEPNRWNDLRLLLTFDGSNWQIAHNAIATTEPGEYYTLHPTNSKGCARIAFGYHEPAWAFGHHKGTQPALVQRGRIRIHRDLNRDGLRNRFEPWFWEGLIGLNDHTTNKRFNNDLIGKHSAGCMVGKYYAQHMDEYLPLLRRDRRYLETSAIGGQYLFDRWILPGDLYTKSISK